LAVAAISAAIADPLVEWASNAGAFGPGAFTDNSNADVLPAFLAGAVFVAAHLLLRVRRALRAERSVDLLRVSSEALKGRTWRLVPLIFALQLAVLFGMETAEQLFVAGRVLGGTLWLGGPVWISLCAQALACVIVTYTSSKFLSAFTRSAVRAVRFVLAMALRPARGVAPLELGRPSTPYFGIACLALHSAGERAPPLS